ncbi:MAG: GNAT superfamily N-acetyltransferase [Psychromonas sp.]|jgi:GNAT superfamily N-acetyltransferase
MIRFEYCNVKTCANELLTLGNDDMKMWYIFKWLSKHDELQYGTQAEIIKLYVDDELLGYALLENFEARTDKIVHHQGVTYQDLGLIHFVVVREHRNKGYATMLANALYKDIIEPLLARHRDVHAYVTATDRAVPLMERTNIPAINLIKQSYSDVTFKVKVINYLREQE